MAACVEIEVIVYLSLFTIFQLMLKKLTVSQQAIVTKAP